jgi:hypothetical protein
VTCSAAKFPPRTLDPCRSLDDWRDSRRIPWPPERTGRSLAQHMVAGEEYRGRGGCHVWCHVLARHWTWFREFVEHLVGSGKPTPPGGMVAGQGIHRRSGVGHREGPRAVAGAEMHDDSRCGGLWRRRWRGEQRHGQVRV